VRSGSEFLLPLYTPADGFNLRDKQARGNLTTISAKQKQQAPTDDWFDSDSDEEEEIEVECDIRMEQLVRGVPCFARGCKGGSITFDCENFELSANMKTSVTRILMRGPGANVSVLCSRMHEGRITFVDNTRALSIMCRCVLDFKPRFCHAVATVMQRARFRSSLQSKHCEISGLIRFVGVCSNARFEELTAFSIWVRTCLDPTYKPESPGSKRRRENGGISPKSGRSPKRQSAGGTGEWGERVQLSEQQRETVDLAAAGKSVFVTGGAGTGKSVVLREIIRRLPQATTFVTASTGVAACIVQGTTLHQFSGLGSSEPAEAEQQSRRISRSAAGERWRRCKALVIDEVSMVCGNTLDALDRVARAVRGRSEPFGGIQVIACGDFFQLPPVSRDGTAPLAFESRVWKRLFKHTVQLQQVFRQSNESFIRLLEEIRWGRCSAATAAQLRSLRVDPAKEAARVVGEPVATRLMTHRSDVDRINALELERLPGPERVFEARDSGDEAAQRQLRGGCTAATVLTLKEGAEVMLLKSLSQQRGLVNGARGTVVGFAGSQGLPVVRFPNGEQLTVQRETWTVPSASGRVATRNQVPLALAWAISVHKAQGVSLDRVDVSLAKVFEAGQAYVAFSRATSLEGLRVLDFSAAAVRANPKVLAFYQSLDGTRSEAPDA